MFDKKVYELQTVLYLPVYQKLWGVVYTYTQSHKTIPGVTNILHRKIYCWWAVVGKNICIKQHGSLNNLKLFEHKKKEQNHYQHITEQELLDMWPDFYEQLERRIIFEVLAND